MKIINLRKQGAAVGPERRFPNGTPHGVRLVADPGKILEKDGQQAPAVDLYPPNDTPENVGAWAEVDAPEEEEPEENAAE